MSGKQQKSREEILEIVLKMNPSMRIGDKSTAEMSDHLMQSVRDSKGPRKFSDEKFSAVFRDMLNELEGELDKTVEQLLVEREALTEERKLLQLKYLGSIVTFLAAAQPGAISEAGKQVLRQQPKLLDALGTSIHGVNQAVLKAGAQF